MIGHLHYIMSSKYELFLFILLSVALVIINYRIKKPHPFGRGFLLLCICTFNQIVRKVILQKQLN